MKKLRPFPTLVIILLSLELGSASLAGPGAPEIAGGRACQADVQKFCPGLMAGKGLWSCMKEKRDQLAPGCKTAIENRKKQHAEVLEEACGDAIQEHCKIVEPGNGRLIRCLKKSFEALPESCKMVIPKRPGKGLI